MTYSEVFSTKKKWGERRGYERIPTKTSNRIFEFRWFNWQIFITNNKPGTNKITQINKLNTFFWSVIRSAIPSVIRSKIRSVIQSDPIRSRFCQRHLQGLSSCNILHLVSVNLGLLKILLRVVFSEKNIYRQKPAAVCVKIHFKLWNLTHKHATLDSLAHVFFMMCVRLNVTNCIFSLSFYLWRWNANFSHCTW